MLKLGAPAPLAFVFTSPAIDTQNPISDPYLRHRALTTQHRQQNRQKLTLQLYDKSMCAYNPEFAPFPAAGSPQPTTMAPKTRSSAAPAREEANTKTATAIFTTSPTHISDSEEILERPTKRPRITHEMKVQHLATRTDASRQAVLQTNELLEGILSFLTPKQLFVDQRVCKQWRDVIAGCPELQRNMFLRVDEVPRQTWGFKAKYSYPDQRILSELRRFDNTPLSQPWRQVTPVVFSPHMTITNDDDGDGDEKEDGSGTSDRDYIAFELPCSLQIRSHSSILDTYFCNPPCYVFEFYLEFKFEPEIPGYRHLSVGGVRVQGGQALRVGEALDRAMAVRTDAVLVRKHRDETITTKKWRYVTGDQITKELQNEYKCVATICKSSMLMLNSVFVPNEQQQAEVDAAYARMKQGSE